MTTLILFICLGSGLMLAKNLLSKMDSYTVSLEESEGSLMLNHQTLESRVIPLGAVLIFWCSLLLVILTYLEL